MLINLLVSHTYVGVLAAVQARLSRKILPRINDEGYVQYALVIPPNITQVESIPLDVAWVVAGASSATDSARQVPEKRYFSAGKKKLPWQADDGSVSPTRKDVGSAPTSKSSSRKVSYFSLHPAVQLTSQGVGGCYRVYPVENSRKMLDSLPLFELV